MAIPQLIPNHTEQLYDSLLGQFKDKPVIRALLKTWTDQIQFLENDIYSLMLNTLFLNAEGSNLSRYGMLLGVIQPVGLPDIDYREQLISEIMRRSSNGTPDKIRQILESTTGMTGTRYFEHINGSQLPYTTGAIHIYGYATPNTLFELSGNTREAGFIKNSAPITTGSCILGLHSFGAETLFIPAELNTNPLVALGVTRNKTTNPDFDLDIANWSISPVNSAVYRRTFEDVSVNNNHGGHLEVTSNGGVSIAQTILGLNPNATYRVQVTQKAGENTLSYLFAQGDNVYFGRFNTSSVLRIPTTVIPTGGSCSISVLLLTRGANVTHGIFRDVSVRNGVLVYDRNNKDVYVDGILANTTDVTIFHNVWHDVRVVYKTPTSYNFIAIVSSGTSSWSGYLKDFKVFDIEGRTLNHYPIFTETQVVGNTYTIPDIVGGLEGTLEGMYPQVLLGNHVSDMKMHGDSVGVVEFSGLSKTTISVYSQFRKGDGRTTYDNFEMIALNGFEQDTLVDQIGNQIAVRDTSQSTGFSVGYQNAILAEFESQIVPFRVESSITPNDFPSTEAFQANGTDQFQVDSEGMIHDVEVEFMDRFADGSLKPRGDKGIFLEISQLDYRQSTNNTGLSNE